GGPFLETVYRQMKDNFQENESLDCLFEQVEDIQDHTIKSYLTKVHRDYQNSKKKDGRTSIAELFQNLKLACQRELEELLEMDHFHLVKSRYIKEKIERL
ncbi:12036_t:CDS:2, partial [Cetraspora pellucida]